MSRHVGVRLSAMTRTWLSAVWPARGADPAAAAAPALQLTDEEILTLLQYAQARDAESGVPDAALTPEARRERTARYGEFILTEILARRQRAQAARRTAVVAGVLVVAVAAAAVAVTGWRPFRGNALAAQAPAEAGRREPPVPAPAAVSREPVAPVPEHASATADAGVSALAAAGVPPRASVSSTNVTASAVTPAAAARASAPAVVRVAEAAPRPVASAPDVVAVVGYAVQVAAVPDVVQAQALRDRLVGGDYPAYLAAVVVEGRTLHRVRIGPLASKQAADTLARRLEADGYAAPWVVRQDAGAAASPLLGDGAAVPCGRDAAPGCAPADGLTADGR